MKVRVIFSVIWLGVSGLYARIPRNILITGAEYFIDYDPGEGRGAPINLVQGLTVDLSVNVGVLQKRG